MLIWQKNMSLRLPNANKLNLSVINSQMQEKHPVISSAEQLALGGTPLSLKLKMPHYVALNHMVVFLCHNFKLDILDIQVTFIEILWKQKRARSGKVFR